MNLVVNFIARLLLELSKRNDTKDGTVFIESALVGIVGYGQYKAVAVSTRSVGDVQPTLATTINADSNTKYLKLLRSCIVFLIL